MSQTPLALTANKIVVLRTLRNGPVKWSLLRKAYFGEARAKQQASTSFYMQLKGMIGKGLIAKSTDGSAYEITPLGTVSIDAVSAEVVANAKSNAQTAFEASGKAAAVVGTEAETETVEA